MTHMARKHDVSQFGRFWCLKKHLDLSMYTRWLVFGLKMLKKLQIKNCVEIDFAFINISNHLYYSTKPRMHFGLTSQISTIKDWQDFLVFVRILKMSMVDIRFMTYLQKNVDLKFSTIFFQVSVIFWSLKTNVDPKSFLTPGNGPTWILKQCLASKADDCTPLRP